MFKNFEAAQTEAEREKKKKEETAEKKRKRELLHREQKEESIRTEVEASKNLLYLKSLLERNELDNITSKLATHLVNNASIHTEELEKLLELIDQVMKSKSTSKFLPESLIITKDEYIKALDNEVPRRLTLAKLNSALCILARAIVPSSRTGMTFTGGVAFFTDKPLIQLQEAHIDLRNVLENTKDPKGIQKNSLSQVGEVFANI